MCESADVPIEGFEEHFRINCLLEIVHAAIIYFRRNLEMYETRCKIFGLLYNRNKFNIMGELAL